MASAVIVLTLAIGIGAGTSVYSVLNVLVIRPLPFHDTETLVRVRDGVTVTPGAPPREVSVSPRRYEQVRDRAPIFEDVAAVRYRTFTLSGSSEPERVIGLWATWNHFSVLGVEPALGRVFGPDEDAVGAPAPVAVVSHSLWLRRYGGDPAAVGSELVVNGRPHTVLGIMPPGFRYPYAGELWVPMGIDPARADYEDGGLNVTARLAPGVSMAIVGPALTELATTLAAERPDTDEHRSFVFRTLEDEVMEGVPQKVVALLWAAVFVLLIGAANVAAMVLARLHAEERDLHVQVALGAGRIDLARRFVAETVVLTLLGLALGLIFSGSTAGTLAALSPVSDLGPYFQNVGLDAGVLAFGAALALVTVVLASAPTVLRLRRRDFGGTLRSGSIGRAPRAGGLTFLDSLVAGEIAVAVVLLTGAGLTVQAVRAEWAEPLGVETQELYTFGVAPASSGYPEPAQRLAYVDEVLERIRAVPGVDVAGMTNLNPVRSHGWGASAWPEGRAPTGDLDYFTLNHRGVTAGYFEAAGTRILAGRGIEASDGPDDPGVVVLSRRTADLFWPGQDALGKSVRVGAAGGTGPLLTVVGVAEDVKEFDFLDETWYRPYHQDPRDYNTRVLEVFVRSTADPALLLPAVREAIRSADPGVPVFRVEGMPDVLRFERRVEAFATLLLTVFAVIGIALAAVGIYGMLSYATGRRSRELGLRVALGASRLEVVRDVTRRTLRSCIAGLVVGLAVSLVATRFLEALIPGVPTFQPGVFASAAVGALLVAVLASVGPSLRALRIHPRTALAGD
jgi:predicted permease